MRYFALTIFAALLFPIAANAQFKDLVNKAKDKVASATGSSSLSNADIAGGLKEALKKGVNEQVTRLTAVDGF